MKVSSSGIERIYQEQVQKVRSTSTPGGEAFKKVLTGATANSENIGPSKFHPPSGVNLSTPIFQGKPVSEVNPVETLRFAAEVVASQPDVRQDRVDAIRKMIESGQYNVSAKDVAEKMLKSGVLTRSWEG